MEIPEFLDSEVLQSPRFIMLTFGAMVALMIGMNSSGLISEGEGIGKLTQLLILACVPVMAYIVTAMTKR